MKRRKLSPNQEVIIIYDVNIGFIEEPAKFLEYRSISIGNNVHNVPIFLYRDKEISGLECFWLLTSDARSVDEIHRLQYELVQTQMVVSQIAKEKGYTIPQKIKSKEIEQMADAKVNRKAAMIKKFGFDPMDEVWIEGELASTTREKQWFKFEREHRLIFTDNWDEIVAKFNLKYNESLTVDDAKGLSKKRMRYILGAHNIRYSGDKDKKIWVTEARQFEQMHRERENRMITWTNAHLNHFPLVRVKKPVRFFTGTYFNECVEKAPSVFTDVSCQHIKEGIVLRVVSYDPKDHYIRLDFTEDIRKLIKGEEQSSRPWIKEGLDYDFWVKPSEVETQLDPLEPLDGKS